MTTSDLLVLLFYVLVNQILSHLFPQLFYYYTLACRLNTITTAAVIDCSVWLTVSFTFDRFISICFQSLRRSYCTPKSAALVIGVIYFVSYVRNIPYYFSNIPLQVDNNVQIGCRPNPSIDTAPAWRVFYWVHVVLTPLAPYVAVALLNLLMVRHILIASQVRRGFRGDGGGSQDPEMQSRRRALVLLCTASASFILLWMPTVGLFLFSRITETYTYRSFNDPFAIVNETGKMLSVLNCSTSTCMYALTQSKFRAELRAAVRKFTRLFDKLAAV
ncbi:probable G-protein coupled receptor 139 isoform X2 [Stegostoma tigrinum]|nr:probable G-protein coupled receptor 139 isoform X2 [Stegostoma tigrinum]